MPLRMIERGLEFVPRDEVRAIDGGQRGIYVLYQRKGILKGKKKWNERYDVLYVGMTGNCIAKRLRQHKRRKKAWTHFSAYAVKPKISRAEIFELEGLFRHLYRRDGRANSLNVQKGSNALRRVCELY